MFHLEFNNILILNVLVLLKLLSYLILESSNMYCTTIPNWFGKYIIIGSCLGFGTCFDQLAFLLIVCNCCSNG